MAEKQPKLPISRVAPDHKTKKGKRKKGWWWRSGWDTCLWCDRPGLQSTV